MDIHDKLTDPSRYAKQPILDGCDTDKKSKPVLDGAANYGVTDLKIKAAAAVQQWADSDIDLGEGETQSDRLFALLVGIVDDNKNGEVDDDEADAFDIVSNFALDYIVRHGADESDAVSLFNEWDEETANRIRDLLIESLPSDDEAADDIDSFGFETEDDNGIFDAVYKKRFAVHNGKKVRINKRISGTVRLSGAQKAAIRKAQKKSHSAGAMMKRAKSMRMRVKSGLNK